jgi:serine/threonine protein kinase
MSAYRAIREIGRGGFGIVEIVADSSGNRFARKTFSPAGSIPPAAHDKLRMRFRREVITQQELGGTEILPVLDHDLDATAPWFVMPLAEKTYQQKIQDDKASSSIEIEPLADILNGLQRLHDLGYVHRDLNPNNVLLCEGSWKLSDLGAVLPPSGHTVTLTEDTIIYTERYCAPEQRQDFHSAQSSADVYSFGCILHDIFGTGARTPYAQHSARGAIGVIIEKCTNKNPSKRPNIELLRTLVLDTLVEEGGHFSVDDEQASEWLAKIEQIEGWNEEEFDYFARFFADLDISERSEGHENDWVNSTSTPFLSRLSGEVIKRIVLRQDGISAAIIEKYCDWVKNTDFLFNFADSICGRLTIIFDYGRPAEKAAAFAALVKLGASHNRWYIMRCMFSRCKSSTLTSEMAKRFSIELRTERLETRFKRCAIEVTLDVRQLPPELAAICA